jgi:hypothetical protein
MKKIFLLLPVFLVFTNIHAQYDLNISMGLDFKSSSSLRDYINSGFSMPGNQMPTFKSSINFGIETDYEITNSLYIGAEYNLQIDSYNNSFGNGGIYDLSYNNHRPSVLTYYSVNGDGFKFKFGGGFGLRYVALTEKLIARDEYSASGFGFILRAVGNTLMSKNFYALIGVDVRYDLIGNLSNNKKTLINNFTGEKLNLISLSVGIFLGVTFTY